MQQEANMLKEDQEEMRKAEEKFKQEEVTRQIGARYRVWLLTLAKALLLDEHLDCKLASAPN